jgi:hypothetical protein
MTLSTTSPKSPKSLLQQRRTADRHSRTSFLTSSLTARFDHLRLRRWTASIRTWDSRRLGSETLDWDAGLSVELAATNVGRWLSDS